MSVPIGRGFYKPWWFGKHQVSDFGVGKRRDTTSAVVCTRGMNNTERHIDVHDADVEYAKKNGDTFTDAVVLPCSPASLLGS